MSGRFKDQAEAVATEPQEPQGHAQRVHPTPQLLGTRAICQRLGVCRHTWRRWVLAQHAPQPVAHVPGHPRWRLVDIENFERGLGTSRFFRAARRVS